MINLTYNDLISGFDFCIRVDKERLWITHKPNHGCCGNVIYIEDVKTNSCHWQYLFDLKNGYIYPLELKSFIEKLINRLDNLKAFI